MKEGMEIAKRFRDVTLNGRWIAGTNLREQIEDLSWEKANQQVASLNTIALLIFHIDYYIGGVVNVFDGGTLDIRDKYSFDMPPIESQADWEKLRNRLYNNAERFAQHVEQMSTEQLDGPFVDPQYGTYRRNIEGMIEHAYYHFGQVRIIKKMILKG